MPNNECCKNCTSEGKCQHTDMAKSPCFEIYKQQWDMLDKINALIGNVHKFFGGLLVGGGTMLFAVTDNSEIVQKHLWGWFSFLIILVVSIWLFSWLYYCGIKKQKLDTLLELEKKLNIFPFREKEKQKTCDCCC